MHVVRAVSGCIAAALVVGCLNYTNHDELANDAGVVPDQRRAEAHAALRRECRRADEVIDGLRWHDLREWRIRACHAPGCERTVPSERTIYVRYTDDERARHEYVHACLFNAGKIDGHHRWMRRHCRFCYGSPACAEACR